MNDDASAAPRLERVLYDACPLCGGQAITDLPARDCSKHPLYKPQLPREMRWCECYECKHVFTEGYFGPAGLEVLFSSTHDYQQPGHEPERGRLIWAGIVERVTAIRGEIHVPGDRPPAGAAAGRWLDVGFGNGALLFTAQEWGYAPLGIDLRRATVEKLVALGVPGRCLALEALDELGAFAVISMANVLEHLPFPKPALEHAHKLLGRDGLLFVSSPNMDTVSWRVLDSEERNPFWAEIEHYHNFSRRRLYALLEEVGFSPVWYGVSNRYRCGMEVIARRAA
ncbi:MAG: class I SAM-dependent methyltransferase [Burkholderiales bacterium]